MASNFLCSYLKYSFKNLTQTMTLYSSQAPLLCSHSLGCGFFINWFTCSVSFITSWDAAGRSKEILLLHGLPGILSSAQNYLRTFISFTPSFTTLHLHWPPIPDSCLWAFTLWPSAWNILPPFTWLTACPSLFISQVTYSEGPFLCFSNSSQVFFCHTTAFHYLLIWAVFFLTCSLFVFLY